MIVTKRRSVTITGLLYLLVYFRRKEGDLLSNYWRPSLHDFRRTTNGCIANHRTACAVH